MADEGNAVAGEEVDAGAAGETQPTPIEAEGAETKSTDEIGDMASKALGITEDKKPVAKKKEVAVVDDEDDTEEDEETTEGGEKAEGDEDDAAAADSEKTEDEKKAEAAEAAANAVPAAQREVFKRFGLDTVVDALPPEQQKAMAEGFQKADQQVAQWGQQVQRETAQEIFTAISKTAAGQTVLKELGIVASGVDAKQFPDELKVEDLLPSDFVPENENERALHGALSKTVQALNQMQARLGGALQQVAGQVGQRDQQEAERVRDERSKHLKEVILPDLAKVYPGMKDEAKAKEVLEEAGIILAGYVAANRNVTAEECLRKAAKIIFADQAPQAAVKKVQEKLKQARRESADAPTGRTPRPTQRTNDVDSAAAKALGIT